MAKSIRLRLLVYEGEAEWIQRTWDAGGVPEEGEYVVNDAKGMRIQSITDPNQIQEIVDAYNAI